MNIVEESKELAIWLHKKIDGISVQSDERTRVAASCFDMVLEHQQAVTMLIENQLFGSAFTLARPAFEAYIRGIWIRDCASDDQLKMFLHEKLSRSFGELIADIEQLEAYSQGVLSSSQKSTWGLLNSFTHTGYNQIVRRNVDDAIQANYSDEDVSHVMRFVNSYGILAGMEIVHLANTNVQSLLEEFLEKAKEHGQRGDPSDP